MTVTLTHIALHVGDIDAAVDFYAAFCGLKPVLSRETGDDGKVIWLAEEGKEKTFIFVLIAGGPGHQQADTDFSHIGFACESRAAVDAVASLADARGCLIWPPRDEPYPVGYYCGVLDPDGNRVEFSYGQPLGPGAGDAAGNGA